jgi:hypothetical protein
MALSRRAAAVAAVAVALGARGTPARAYGFAVHTRVIAQVYDLRSIRLLGPDVWLGRRRYTQTLALDLVDLGDLAARRRKQHKRFGPTVSFTSYLRIDHDFGDWTAGSVDLGGRPVTAMDAVPELRDSSLALDLLYAYVDVTGLADGRVDLRAGRQVRVDALDWFAMDGVTARVTTPLHVAIEGFGGLRVRDASPLGSYQLELDGTTGADCTEYVEGATPGTGSWQLIDRTQPLGDHPGLDDTGYCPQRDQWMPTYGAAIETEGFHDVYARIMYRRSVSPTVGLIGPVDRLGTTDAGYYPNEYGQAPAWGVDEERVAATVRGNFTWAGGRGQASPWVAARYSLLDALIDQAEAGVRLRWGSHAIQPEVGYRFPTFDGDSIFNVFAIEPSTEGRLTWSWAPRHGRMRATAGAWVRRYQHDDEGQTTAAPAQGDLAVGIDASADARLGDRWRVRGDLFDDGGYGGTRAGGAASARFQRDERLSATARATVLDIQTDATGPIVKAVTAALQLGATWQLADGVAVHGVVEGSSDRYAPVQVRALGVLDLAYVPEM